MPKRSKEGVNEDQASTDGGASEALLTSLLADSGRSASEEPVRSGDKEVLRGTVYEDVAVRLWSAMQVARKRDTDEAFAQVIDVALDLRRLWTAAEMADFVGVAVSTLSKWRNSNAAPRNIMRRATLRELSDRLVQIFGASVTRGGVELYAVAPDLGVTLRGDIIKKAHARLKKPEAVNSGLEFTLNLRLCRELRDLGSAKIAKATDVPESTLSRWSRDEKAPSKFAVRRTFVEDLRSLVDEELKCRDTPVEPIEMRRAGQGG